MADVLSHQDHDPTIYPVSDDMGTSSFELFLRLLLLPLVRRWLAHQGRPCFVGADQFVYWERFNPSKCVAPDLYLCPALPPEALPDALKLWELGPGAVPFALEVVSENKGKDYVVAPRKYEELGTKELVIYDPKYEHREGGWRWQVYRRKRRGGWKRPVVSNEDRVWSEYLAGWLRVVEVQQEPLLRLGMGQDGEELFPTQEEEDAQRLQAERQAKEAAERQVQAAEQQALQDAREAIADLCEVLTIPLTPDRLAHLASLDLPALRELRALLKQRKTWPG